MSFRMYQTKKENERKERQEFYDEIVENYLSQVFSGELF